MANWQGRVLKEAREGAGLSQLALAGKLDTTQAVVQGWESGELVPSGLVLAELADAVAIDPVELFTKDEQSGYRTHSKVSQSQHMEMGQAQEQAELARLRQQVLDAEDAHSRAIASYRSADPWSNGPEAQRLHEAGERLAALSAKLKAHESGS